MMLNEVVDYVSNSHKFNYRAGGSSLRFGFADLPADGALLSELLLEFYEARACSEYCFFFW